MIDERTEDLMWQKIDGTISPLDDAELSSILVANRSARECFDELVRFSETLASVESVEPPAQLRGRIESAVRWRQSGPGRNGAVSAPGFWKFLAVGRSDLRLAVAGVAGLALGIVGYHLLSQSNKQPLSIGELTGTMTRHEGSGNALEIGLDEAQGRVGFQQDGRLAVAKIDLTSENEIEVQLQYEGTSLGFGALGQDEPVQDVSLKGNTISVRHRGENHYVVVFENDGPTAAPVHLRILDRGALLMDRELVPDKAFQP